MPLRGSMGECPPPFLGPPAFLRKGYYLAEDWMRNPFEKGGMCPQHTQGFTFTGIHPLLLLLKYREKPGLTSDEIHKPYWTNMSNIPDSKPDKTLEFFPGRCRERSQKLVRRDTHFECGWSQPLPFEEERRSPLRRG